MGLFCFQFKFNIYIFDWSINLIYVTPNSTLKIKVAHIGKTLLID
jgi:hypothetical protein